MLGEKATTEGVCLAVFRVLKRKGLEEARIEL